MADEPSDAYPPEEAQRRFEQAVKAALNTPPLPLKDVPRPRRESKGRAPKPTKAKVE